MTAILPPSVPVVAWTLQAFMTMTNFSRRGCWRCPRCPTTSPSRVLSCLVMPTVSDWSNTKTRHGEMWPCTHRSPPGRLAWRSGIGGAPAAATERLCYRAAAGYMFVCECICMCVVSEGAQTRRPSSTSPSLASWPVAGGGRGTGAATTIMCFGRRSGGGWTGYNIIFIHQANPG